MVDGTEFNWVQARLNCSATKAFVELKRLVERDVATRNAGRADGSREKFEVDGDISNFTVFRYMEGVSSNAYLPKSVQFVLLGQNISLKVGDKDITSTLALNKEGRCVFKIGEEEFESWQFRMKALEDLFFN